MDTNGEEVSWTTITTQDGSSEVESGEDLLLSVKSHEALELQKNMSLLSQLSTFDTFLSNVYELSCPSSEDYASRRDLVRVFNALATEIYGDNDGCPVVEGFGSFLMDMFNFGSDLDLSINFKDKKFEADRMEKIRTLRKFAKKFDRLKKEGQVKTVELIMSARVPVLKVTDSSLIDCDFSVGNRDGIAKSQFVLTISAIDERFKKLGMMTRDIPILPPFSAILKDGMDLVDVNLDPSFLNYGQRNTESLAELFVSLLVKLLSAENFWSKGLCASTYEGSWIYKNWKATGCIRIEDFSDRSENTARAVKSTNMNKIYSSIRCSLQHIQAFTEGKFDAGKLKELLFVGVTIHPKKSKKNSRYPAKKKKKKKAKSLTQVGPSGQKPNSTQKKKKRSAQVGPEGQRPGKQVKLNHCKTDEVLQSLSRNPIPLSNPPIQGLRGVTPIDAMNNNAVLTFLAAQSYGIRPAQIFGESGHQRASVGNHNVIPTSQVAQSYSNRPAQSFGESGHQRAGVGNHNAFPTSQVAQSYSNRPAQSFGESGYQRAGVGNHNAFPTSQVSYSNRPAQSFGESGHQRASIGNHNAIPTSQVAQSYSYRPAQSFGESAHPRASVGNLNAAPSSFPVRHYSLSHQPIEQYGGYRPHRTNDVPSSHGMLNFPEGQLSNLPNRNFQSSGGFPLDQAPQQSNHLHVHGYGRFSSENFHVDRLRNGPPNIPAGPPYPLSNTPSHQMSDPYSSRPTSVMPPYQPSPSFHTFSHRNPAELNTPNFPISGPYTLAPRPGGALHPNHGCQPHQAAYNRNLADLPGPHDARQSLPVRSQFAGNMHPHYP